MCFVERAKAYSYEKVLIDFLKNILIIKKIPMLDVYRIKEK